MSHARVILLWPSYCSVGEKVRKKRKVLDIDVLFSPEGLPKLHQQFPLIKWDTRKDCETKFLNQLVSMYKNWSFQLWPKMNFVALVERLERLGHKTAIKHVLNDMRYGTPPDWDVQHGDDDRETKLSKVALNDTAREIFDAFANTLQSNQSKKNSHQDHDDDEAEYNFDDDDLLAALADKYSKPGSIGASAGDPSNLDPASTAAAVDNNIHALLARKRAAEAEQKRKDAEEQARMEQKYEEEAELDVVRRITTVNGLKGRKKMVTVKTQSLSVPRFVSSPFLLVRSSIESLFFYGCCLSQG